jgi:phosphoribosylanthranilate isomerase
MDSLSFASYAIKQGVDFLGVHVLEEKNIGEHLELVKFIRERGGRAVIVTKIESLDALVALVTLYQPDGIQLHYTPNYQILIALRIRFPTLLLFGVVVSGSVHLLDSSIDEVLDFLVYDASYTGGTGVRQTYEGLHRFSSSLRMKTLLAGGVDHEVVAGLSTQSAAGYDVQSSLRSGSDFNFRELNLLCNAIKPSRRGRISVSLTDMPLIEVHRAAGYMHGAHLDYHLDMSAGDLYPSFVTTRNGIAEKAKALAQLPFGVHLFIRDRNLIQKQLDKLSILHPLNLTRVFVQYYPGLRYAEFEMNGNQPSLIPSIYYRDLNDYFSSGDAHQTISVVLPKFKNDLGLQGLFTTLASHAAEMSGREIWFDRNVDALYVNKLQKLYGKPFNVIVGKEVVNDWNKIDTIDEQLSTTG